MLNDTGRYKMLFVFDKGAELGKAIHLISIIW